MISIKKKWIRTDGWRGYEEFYSEQLPYRVLCGALYSPESIKQETENIRIVKRLIRKKGGICRVCKGKTSNVFSRCYDILSNINISDAELKKEGVVL